MPRLSLPSPEDRRWVGINPGEFAGNVYLTKNISFERNPGKITLQESLTEVFDEADSGGTNLSSIVDAFERTNADGTDRYWALVSGGRLFKSNATDPEAGWAEDAIGSTPTAADYDMIEFQDALLVSLQTDIARLSTSWNATFWTGLSGASALTTGVPHRFAIHSGAVLITDGRFVNTYDGTTATDPALTLPNDFESQFILSTADFSWICTKAVGGNLDAEVFSWDRTSGDNYNARYSVGDIEVLAGFVVNGIPYIITKKGAIKKFTGQGFNTIQQFPSVEIGIDIEKIDPNGVIVMDEDLVLINVRFGITTNFGIDHMRILDGVWVFNVNTNNLYHSYSYKNTVGSDFSQQEVVDVGAMMLTVTTKGRFLVAADVYTVYAGTARQAIFSSDETNTSQHRGYFITTKIRSSDIQRFWRQIFSKFRRLRNSTDRIRVMYRIQDDNSLPAYETITWASTTTFTGTNSDVAVNDFVEVLAGDNAGVIAKISAIASGSPNTYTIDVTVNSSSNAARARYLKFIDLGEISSQTIQKEVFRMARKAPWIQFMFSFVGDETSPEFEEMVVDFTDKSF